MASANFSAVCFSFSDIVFTSYWFVYIGSSCQQLPDVVECRYPWGALQLVFDPLSEEERSERLMQKIISSLMRPNRSRPSLTMGE